MRYLGFLFVALENRKTQQKQIIQTPDPSSYSHLSYPTRFQNCRPRGILQERADASARNPANATAFRHNSSEHQAMLDSQQHLETTHLCNINNPQSLPIPVVLLIVIYPVHSSSLGTFHQLQLPITTAHVSFRSHLTLFYFLVSHSLVLVLHLACRYPILSRYCLFWDYCLWRLWYTLNESILSVSRHAHKGMGVLAGESGVKGAGAGGFGCDIFDIAMA